MVHTLIIGQSLSGKTTLAKKILKRKRELSGRPLLVLDPLLDPGWDADFITDNKEKFLEIMNTNKKCELAIDESGESIGRFAKEMMPVGTRSRHRGHTATFIAQRCQQIDRNVRDQCSRLFLFSVSRPDAKILAEDWVDDSLNEAYTLSAGDCLIKCKFKPIVKINVFNSENV